MFLVALRRLFKPVSRKQKILLHLSVGILMGHVIAQFFNFCSLSKPTDTTTMKSYVSLYIGILSTRNYLSSRGITSVNTWAKNCSATVELFADVRTREDPVDNYHFRTLNGGRRVVSLPGVKDDVYPPQKKSFSAIKYMHDFHLDNFDWFVRLDDDAYVKVDELKKFLNRIDASEPWYIGEPAFGVDKGDRVAEGENYCKGGPGAILSRGLLRMLGPHLRECLGQLYTEHEDIELGRCITRFTGVRCTMALDAKELFHQHFERTGHMPDIKTISKEVLDKALTFHANKHTEPQLRLHSKVLSRKLHERIRRITELQLHMNKIQNWTESRQENRMLSFKGGKTYTTVMEGPGMPLATAGRVAYEQVRLRLEREARGFTLNGGKLSCLKPVGYHTEVPLVSLNAQVEITCLRGRFFNVLPIPTSGQFTVRLTYRRKLAPHAIFWHENENLTSEIEALTRRRKCGKSNEIAECGNSGRVPVNFCVSLSGRQTTFNRFLQSFEEAFLKLDENINLIVTYFSTGYENQVKQEKGYDTEIIQRFTELRLQYPNSVFKFVKMETGLEFSRGLGLHECAKQVEDNEILFFCDVDLVFAPELLMHIRRNTFSGKQAYYPAFFSEYDPKVVEHKTSPKDGLDHLQDSNGFWRYFSYGMVSMYTKDYFRTRGFDLSIKGWGLEDMRLVDKVVHSGLNVFRANEPAQIHVFHEKFCDENLPKIQLKSCRRSRANHFGSSTLMYKLWRERQRARFA